MNYAVREQVALLNGSRALLLDMPISGSQVVNNVVCEAPDGSLLWTACPGEFGPDKFVGLRVDDALLVANTWSGFAVWLDPTSGREVRSTFTK